MRIVMLLALLPYFRVTPLGSDVQPYFLLAFVIYLIFYGAMFSRLPFYKLTLVIASLFALAAVALNAKEVAISIFVAPIAIDVFSRQTKDQILWSLKAATILLFLGTALNLVAESVLIQIVSNFRTSDTRGLNSLTSEPSYLGILGFTLTVCFYFLEEKKWALAASALVALSGSATAILPLIIFWVLTFLSIRGLVLLPVFITLVYFGLNYVAQSETRFGILANTLLNSPSLIFLDVSVSNRILRAIGPLAIAWNDYFIPHDFSEAVKNPFVVLANEADSEIHGVSNIGTVLFYGFGFLSIPIFFSYLAGSAWKISLIFAIFFMFLANISSATPYLYLILALPIWLKRNSHLQIQPPLSAELERTKMGSLKPKIGPGSVA